MASSLIRILIISVEYPPYTFGGVGSYVKDLAEILSKNKKMFITVISGRNDNRHNLCFEFVKKNLSIVRVWFPHKPFRPIWFQEFNKKIIVKLASTHDIIHINPPDGSMLLPQIQRLGKHVVATFHGSMLEQMKLYLNSPLNDLLELSTLQDVGLYILRGKIQADLEQLSYDLSDYSIFVARHVAEEFRKYFGYKRGGVKVVYPAAGREWLKEGQSPFPSTNNFFYSGRLYYLKGPHYALEAFTKYITEFKNIDYSEFHVYGKGPLLNKLKKKYDKSYKYGRIRFFGFIDRQKYLKIVPTYKALIFPSIYEGCPFSVIEALSLGIPVITFNTGWITEFKEIFQRNIITAETYNIDNLAYIMSDEISNLSIKQNIGNLLRFSKSYFSREMIKIYYEFIR